MDSYSLLLDELNIDKAYVMGTSAGGTSALQFALRFPERCKGLILVSSNVPLSQSVKAAPKSAMKVIFGYDIAYWLFSKIMGINMLPMAGTPKSLAKKLPRRKRLQLLQDIILGGLPISERTHGVLNDMYLSNPDINSGYPFEKIRVPVLMIGAKDDPLCLYEGFETLRRKIKDVRAVSYESGGHLILGHEKDIQREISDFINLTR